MHILAFGTGKRTCAQCPHKVTLDLKPDRVVELAPPGDVNYVVRAESSRQEPTTRPSSWLTHSEVLVAMGHRYLIELVHPGCNELRMGDHGNPETIGYVFKCGEYYFNVTIEPVYPQ